MNKILKRQEDINKREKQYEKNNAKSLEEMLAEQIKKILELKGREKDILNFIEEQKYVNREPVEVEGYKGKIVYIKLPAMGNFEGLNFAFFISDDKVLKKTFLEKPELVEKSYSMKDIGDLLGIINRFMIELGLKNDGDMDYEEELKTWKYDNWRCKAGDFLRKITCSRKFTGLEWWYLLKDATWFCDPGYCHFTKSQINDYSDAYLLLNAGLFRNSAPCF